MIADQHMKVAQLRALLTEAEGILKGMELLYSVTGPTKRRSAAITSQASQSGSSSGGRQPGAISQRWRLILNALYNREEGFNPQDTADLVLEIEKRVMKPSEARRILEGYEGYGYIARNGAGQMFVTQEAATKFGFVKIATTVQEANATAADLINPLETVVSMPHLDVKRGGLMGNIAKLSQQADIFKNPTTQSIVPASQWVGAGRTLSTARFAGGEDADD
jgi:hypothetical protein